MTATGMIVLIGKMRGHAAAGPEPVAGEPSCYNITFPAVQGQYP
jgi:hypothetical protein